MNLSPYVDVALRAARLAGDYQMRHFGKVQKISYKGKINIVTQVDKGSERLILKTLRGKFPLCDYLTEETDIAQTGKSHRWIIDPLDGTTNYAHEYPCFCVSIALEVNGKICLGVVYAPFSDELFCAVKGEGATMRTKKGIKRLKVSRIADLQKALLVTGFPYSVREDPRPLLAVFEHFIMNAQGVRRDGSAALNLCYVAAGRLDGFWETNLHPWDTAAGQLIVREAGGKNTDFQGNPFVPAMRTILSSNGLLHERMLRIIAKAKDTFRP